MFSYTKIEILSLIKFFNSQKMRIEGLKNVVLFEVGIDLYSLMQTFRRIHWNMNSTDKTYVNGEYYEMLTLIEFAIAHLFDVPQDPNVHTMLAYYMIAICYIAKIRTKAHEMKNNST